MVHPPLCFYRFLTLVFLASLIPAQGTTLAEPTKPADRVAGTRVVVAAVLQEARVNARRAVRKKGNALTEAYLRVAARAASTLPADQAPGAFLLGIGVALDDSTILRSNPLVSGLINQIESDEERTARLAVLGSPTIQGRRDWCQHFVVSCALTELVGAELAETAGLLKEHLDSRPGGSGFSFADLGADLAGIAFSKGVKGGTISLKTLAGGFRVGDHVPDLQDLPEGINGKRFEQRFGSMSDPRFQKKMKAIKTSIQKLPAYRSREGK
jgi:hypothetical protein